MTELQELRQRRDLVVLAAELQRANVVRRLDRIQANPARKLLGLAAAAVRRPALLHARDRRNRVRGSRLSKRRSARIQASLIFSRSTSTKEIHMLYWAAVFFIIALIAAVLGFGGIAAGAAGIAKILFFVFLVAFVVSLLMGVFRRST